MSSQPPKTRRPRWRLVGKALMALVLIGVVLAIALPSLLSTGFASRLIHDRAEALLRPARLEVTAFQFSWFSPTKMTGFVLVDREGAPCLSSDVADWDRTLWQILFDRPRFGTLTFPGGTVRLVRDDQGEINIIEAIRPILRKDPRLDIRFRIPHGALTVVSPELPRPFEAGDADVDLHIPVNLAPLRLHTELAPKPGDTEHSMIVDALVPRQEGETSLTADVECRSYPFPIELATVRGGCLASGELHLGGEPGSTTIRGDLTLADLDLTADLLRGDHIRIDRLTVALDLAQQGAVWTIRKALADSAMLQVSASGQYPPSDKAGTTIDGKVDLPRLLSQMPRLVPLREGMKWSGGTAQLHADAYVAGDGEAVKLHAELAGLEGTNGDRVVKLHDPAKLDAGLTRRAGVTSVEHFALRTAFLDLDGSGDLDRGLIFQGNVQLAGLQRQAADLIDFGKLDLAGDGKLSGRYQRQGETYDFAMAMDLAGLRVSGLPLIALDEPTLTLRLGANGRASAQGLPRGLTEAKLAIESRALRADLVMTEKLQGHLQMPLEIAGGSGQLQADASGRWESDRLEIDDLRLIATPSQGQPISMAVSGTFDRQAGSLKLRPIEADPGAIALTPAGLKLSGLNGEPVRVDGGLAGRIEPLARFVADWTGKTAANLLGSWTAQFSVREEGGVYRGSGRLDLPDLTRPAIENQADAQALLLPIAAQVQAEYDKARDRLTIRPLEASGDVASLALQGTIDQPMGRRVVDLNGAFALNQELFQAFLTTRVEPEANIVLRPREFRIQGPLSGDSPLAILRGLDAEFGIDVEHLDVYGLKFGPMPLVARIRGGQVAIDPIRAELNGGMVDVRPIVEIDDDRGAWLGFVPGSGFQNIHINEEVSRRYLFYAAPMLYNATSVRGIVSGRIDQASIPLYGADADDQAAAQGVLDFQQVTFYPGPVFREVVETIRLPGLATIPLLRLDQPVAWQLKDGRVYQPGMSYTLVDVMTGELSGSVGLDKTLDLLVRMPVVPGIVDRIPILGEFTSRNKLEIPIEGTIAEPKTGKARFGPELARPGGQPGLPPAPTPNNGQPNRNRDPNPVGGLLDMINQLIPRPAANPGAVPAPTPIVPPPPGPGLTPEQRRLERQQKQQEKRQQRLEKQQARKNGDG